MAPFGTTTVAADIVTTYRSAPNCRQLPSSERPLLAAGVVLGEGEYDVTAPPKLVRRANERHRGDRSCQSPPPGDR